jgi:hypothetical protein
MVIVGTVIIGRSNSRASTSRYCGSPCARLSRQPMWMTMSTSSGLLKDAAVRSNVPSSKSQFGDAICQISLLNSRRFSL